MYTHMNFTGKGFIGTAEVTTKDDKKRGTIRLASTDSWKDADGERQERTNWFTLTVFKPSLVEMIEKGWIAKGRYVDASGDLRENRWADAEGSERFDVQLIAERIQFLDRKPTDNDDE
ncbi:MAG: single-stranded DNA-binding protein [Rhodospirillales bacterium]